MPRSGGQKMKLITLARILWEETDEDHPMTLAEVIRRLEAQGIPAERKSLYDDLEELSLFGLDVVRIKAKNTGYYLGDRLFELPELRLLVDAVQSSRFLSHRKSETLIRKLQKLASNHQALHLARQVTVAGRVKSMNESVYRNVDALSTAVENDRAVSFLYMEWTSSGAKTPRRGGARYRVAPYLLHWDNENYYLIGVEEESGAIRHFRVDKMQNILQEEDRRWGAEVFRNVDPADYEKKAFDMFGGKDESVDLWVREDLAGVFFDRFGKLVTRKSEGGFETTVRVMVSPPFLSWLMGFGKGVRVLGPESVKQEILSMARDVLAANGEPV